MFYRFPAVFALALTCAFQSGRGCTIPVFRYALDRWEADAYRLVLPARSASDPSQNELLRPMRANGKANLDIQTTKDTALAKPELRFSSRDQASFWSGAIDAESLGQILDSPMRKKLTEHILAGDSIVWVVAEKGTPEDAAHLERIEKRIQFLEQVASLPIQDPNDPDSQLGPGPALKLAFTVLKLRADDPSEALFLKMLAGPKSGIDPTNTSFAAAVFGRGRVLGAWSLDVLDDTALEDASMFLVGRCSCRLKNENPGWDILMNVDWVKALENVGKIEPGKTEPPSQSAREESLTTKANPAPEAEAKSQAFVINEFAMSPNRWTLLAIGGALLLALAAFVLFRSGGVKK
jgi:hypothetical protein